MTRFTLCLSLILAIGGCYPKGAGQDLAQRLDAVEETLTTERDARAAQEAASEARIASLEASLSETSRQNADLGAEVQELRSQLQSTEGQLAEAQNSIDGVARAAAQRTAEINQNLESVARRAGVDMPVEESQIPQDPAEHFNAAVRAYQANNYSLARALFRAFAQRHGEHERADDAQFWIGKSYLEERRPANALGAFRNVIADHGEGDMVDDALLEMGNAFYSLHACTDARSALDALIQTHRDSPLLSQAREKLRVVRRAPRGYCTS